MAKERGPGKKKPAKKGNPPVPIRVVASKHEKPVTALAFAPDGRTLVSGSDDATVRLWDVTTGRECNAGLMSKAQWGITEVAFSPDGCKVAVVSRGVNSPVAGDTRAFLWDLIKRGSVELDPDHAKGFQFRSPTFSPGDDTVAFLHRGVSLYSAAAGERIGEFSAGGKGDRIAYSADGARIVFGDWQGPLRVLDVAGRRETSRVEGHTDSVTALAFSPDGRRLASSTSSYGQDWPTREEDRSVRVWDFEERAQLARWSEGWETTACLAFLADNTHLISFHDPHGKACAKLWAVDAVDSLATWSPPESATAVAVWSTAAADQRTGGLIVTGHRDGSIRLWDIADVLPAPGIGRMPAPTPPTNPIPAGEQPVAPRTEKPGRTTEPAPDEYDEFFPS